MTAKRKQYEIVGLDILECFNLLQIVFDAAFRWQEFAVERFDLTAFINIGKNSRSEIALLLKDITQSIGIVCCLLQAVQFTIRIIVDSNADSPAFARLGFHNTFQTTGVWLGIHRRIFSRFSDNDKSAPEKRMSGAIHFTAFVKSIQCCIM